MVHHGRVLRWDGLHCNSMTKASRVLQALTEGPATSGELSAELSAELGMPNNTVSAYLCYQLRKGRVRREMHKKGYQRAYLWRVIDTDLTLA